ncbi:4Fe-4S dicluster domain-containing protein [Desulfonatronospira sp. MSAO_Bac3]|uniref:4Fe-4S dicluster domain-containing protein n=1 Tax=Desulfonatronospira sp. MSAO_Bac3 TaxID=2293857 RepID=UPI000FF25C42|nr:4Fe-4S dicluster domain-containing protein [Desulfonatronospira sp. MSAO_Bac3]RQD79052.1 MAG: 4Fe-4S ferredoxin [Desulfonatronospira sp. MSAO_Bac3]
MTVITELKEQIKTAMPDLDMVIGWERGFDPLHATPLFMRKAQDVERLELGPLAVHNTATYLTGFKGKKVGLVVKGCDSRAVIQLLQEGLIDRENVVIFGFPCQGVVDMVKVQKHLGNTGLVREVQIQDSSLKVKVNGEERDLALKDVLADKCARCRYPNAMLYDHFAGQPIEPHASEDKYQDVEELESLSLEERFQHWEREMHRCIRCYACRNACPMCVCRDHCVAQSRQPQWLTQEDSVREKWMFQVIHAMHLAGRCVECGECQRACPMDIPIMALKRKLNREARELFNYEAGVDPNETAPLLSFKVEEENINERGW